MYNIMKNLIVENADILKKFTPKEEKEHMARIVYRNIKEMDEETFIGIVGKCGVCIPIKGDKVVTYHVGLEWCYELIDGYLGSEDLIIKRSYEDMVKLGLVKCVEEEERKRSPGMYDLIDKARNDYLSANLLDNEMALLVGLMRNIFKKVTKNTTEATIDMLTPLDRAAVHECIQYLYKRSQGDGQE